MLNGLHVDFDRAQGLICKETTPHALRIDLLKTRDSFVKVALRVGS
jgi:hypothetical protein